MKSNCIYCGKSNVTRCDGVCPTCAAKQVVVKKFIKVCEELKEIIEKLDEKS